MPRYFLTCRQNTSFHIEMFANETTEFAVGRSYENNLITVKNKLISRHHCQLFKEPDNSVRLLVDSDVNGVVINDRLLLFNEEEIKLQNGDEFYVLHSRKHPEQHLSFILSIENDNSSDLQQIQDLMSQTLNMLASETSLSYDSPEQITAEVQNSEAGAQETENPAEKATPPENMAISPPPAPVVSPATQAALKPEAQLSSSLQCSICISILYDPVTLAPCMHNFCAGCCSAWLATNKRCPSCRHKVSMLSKNPSLRAILEAYVAANPDSEKSSEEKATLDGANRFTFVQTFLSGNLLPLNEHVGELQTLINRTSRGSGSDFNVGSTDTDDDSDDEDDDSGDEEEEEEENTGWPACSDTEVEETEMPERPEFEHDHSSTAAVCRECENAGEIAGVDGNTSNTAYICRDLLQHVICNCCESPFPDRRTDKSAPPQTCLICSEQYCNLYWSNGCLDGQCQPKCLKLLKDLDLHALVDGDLNAPSESSVAVLMFGNIYELTQLRNYLAEKNISAGQLREILLNGLESNKYCTSKRTIIGARPSRNTPVCTYCRVNVVQDLLFEYRRQTRDAAADSRPNCPHGRYCVSQGEDVTHATVVNHICQPNPPGVVIDCTTFLQTSVSSQQNDFQKIKSNPLLDLD